jgi:hypothetical protein
MSNNATTLPPLPEGCVFTDNTSLMSGERFLFDNNLVLNPGTGLSSLSTIVELLCLYDYVAVDKVVLYNSEEALRVKHAFSEVVVGVEAPYEIYEKIFNKLTDFRHNLKCNHDDVLIETGDKEVLYDDGLFFQKFQNYLPILEDGSLSPESLMGRQLRNSDDHFLRTLFYNEMARFTGVPYVPHQCRVNFLFYLILLELNPNLIRELNARINRDAWSVQRSVLTRIEHEIIPVLDQKRLNFSLSFLSKLSIPPLVRYFQDLLRNGRFNSLADAIAHERNEDDCKAFRNWCNKATIAIQNSEATKIDECVFELDQAIQNWTAKLGIEEKVRRTKIVLGTLVGSEMTIPDPVIPLPKALRRNKHLLFLHKLIKA